MKKSSLLFGLLLLAGRMSATDAYCYDFEPAGTVPSAMSSAGWLLSGPSVVANPLKADLNQSDNVLTFEAQAGIEWWGGSNLTLESATTTENMRYMRMLVRYEGEVTTDFSFSLFNEGTYLETVVHTFDGEVVIGNDWMELGFVLDTDVTFNEIRITPNIEGVFHVDNIRLCDEVVIPEELPDLEPISLITFEDGNIDAWSANGNGASIEVFMNPAIDPLVNKSENVLKAWIPQGFSPNYNGAKLNVSGMTTENSRYLHVKYFFHQNEEQKDPRPLEVLVDGAETIFESEPCNVDEWAQVTLDLGVGTRVKFMTFFVDGWWQNLYIDDISLNNSPTVGVSETEYNDDVKIVANGGNLSVLSYDNTDAVEVYALSGVKVANSTIESGSFRITLPRGVYIVKVANDGELKVVKKVIL